MFSALIGGIPDKAPPLLITRRSFFTRRILRYLTWDTAEPPRGWRLLLCTCDVDNAFVAVNKAGGKSPAHVMDVEPDCHPQRGPRSAWPLQESTL